MPLTPLSELLPHGFIDAHHHVWAPENRGDEVGYGWLRDIGAMKPFGDPTPIQRDYLWPEFLTEASLKPISTVHVQTDGALPDPVAETRFVADTAKDADHEVAIVGLVDLALEDCVDVLGRHMQTPGFRGVRQIVSYLPDTPSLSFAPRDLLADTNWRCGLAKVNEAGLRFDLQCYPEQMAAAADVFAAFPTMPVILDHAGSPRNGMDALWREGTARLAALPHVSVKLSGWGMFDANWSAESITPLVAQLLHHFGAERVMFGSNYPVEKLAKPYEDVLRDTHQAVSSIDADAVEWVFRKTAEAVYQPSA